MKLKLWFMTLFIATMSWGQTTVTIGTGTDTQRFPLGNYFGYERSSSLFTSTEIGTTGTIKSVAWYADSSGAGRPIKIYLKTTTNTTSGTGTWANEIAGATLVFNGTVTPVEGWNTIQLTDNFDYTGGNLLVLVEANAGGGGSTGSAGSSIRYTYNQNKHSYWQTDNSAPTGNANSRDGYRPNIQLSINSSYCTPADPSSDCSGDNISSVKLGIITDTGLSCSPYYEHRTATTDLNAGSTYSMSVGVGNGGTEYVGVWIDFNQNGTFESNEFFNLGNGNNTTITNNISIPIGALTGSTRMRVRSRWNNVFTYDQACTQVNYGTTRDYTINIVGACSPGYTNGCSNGAAIGEVSTSGGLVNISNVTGCSGGYINYSSNHKLEAVQGASISQTVKLINFSGGVKVWIDYNQNGTFESNELVINTDQVVQFGGNGHTGNYTIPTTALLGETRMRVRVVEGNVSFDACSNYSYGEVEDYLVNIVACTTPLISTASNISFTSANLNWLETASGSYEVQWANNAGFSGATSQPLTTTKFSISGLTPNTTYYYRVRSVCGAGVYSGWSATESFKTGSYTPFEVSGFNQDVIANGNGTASQTTTAGIDAGGFALLASGFKNGGSTSYNSLPSNQVLKNANGTAQPSNLVYFLQNYNQSNSLRLPGGNGTLTFDTPVAVTELYLAGTTGNSAANLKIEVVYQDGGMVDFNRTLNDWWNEPTYIAKLNNRVNRSNNTMDLTVDNPRIYQLDLTGLDGNRLVKEIRITNTNGSSSGRIANIFAVSGLPTYARVTNTQVISACAGEEITLQVSGENATSFKWYTQANGGSAVATTSGNWTTTVNANTTYYVAALNGSIENPSRRKVEVILNDSNFTSNTGNWDLASNWSTNALPTAETCVKVPNGKILTVNVNNAVAKKVLVENGGKLVVDTGKSLKVEKEIINQAGKDNFIVRDGANLVQIDDSAVNVGAIKVEKEFKFSAGRQQYNFVSIPVEDFFLKGSATNDPLYAGMSYVLKYNEATDYFVNATNADHITGKGFAIKEGSGSGAQTVNGIFTGVPFNGNASIALAKTGQGFNVIGNPYPSTLDLEQFYADNQQVLGSTFWFWDNRNNTLFEQQGSAYDGSHYANYNTESHTGNPAPAFGTDTSKKPNQFVKPGTGFMVQVKEGHVDLNVGFNNTQRSVSTTGISFTGKMGQATQETNGWEETMDRYWLLMNTPVGLAYSTAIVYFEGGNNGYWIDDSDAFGSSDELYSVVDGKQVIIQGKEPFVNTDVVPMGFRAFKRGNYSIAISDKEGVFANGQKIYLRDKDLGVTHDFNQGAYSFKTQKGEFNNRFEIVYKPNKKASLNSLAEVANVVHVQKVNQQIEVKSSLDKIVEVEIFNLSGRSIAKAKNIHELNWTMPTKTIDKQILVVVVKTETGEVVTKKVITK